LSWAGDIYKLYHVFFNKANWATVPIDERNDNLAHAKGGIEPDPDGKIQKYLSDLKMIQFYMLPLNDKIADNWIVEQ